MDIEANLVLASKFVTILRRGDNMVKKRLLSRREHGKRREERARPRHGVLSHSLSLLDPPRGSPANLQKPYMLFP